MAFHWRRYECCELRERERGRGSRHKEREATVSERVESRGEPAPLPLVCVCLTMLLVHATIHESHTHVGLRAQLHQVSIQLDAERRERERESSAAGRRPSKPRELSTRVRLHLESSGSCAAGSCCSTMTDLDAWSCCCMRCCSMCGGCGGCSRCCCCGCSRACCLCFLLLAARLLQLRCCSCTHLRFAVWFAVGCKWCGSSCVGGQRKRRQLSNGSVFRSFNHQQQGRNTTHHPILP